MSPRLTMDALFSQADLRCAVCGAKDGECDCWAKCECGWRFRRGETCRNPIHGGPPALPQAVAVGKLPPLRKARKP